MCEDVRFRFDVALSVLVLVAIALGSIAAIIVILALQVDLDKRPRAFPRVGFAGVRFYLYCVYACIFFRREVTRLAFASLSAGQTR